MSFSDAHELTQVRDTSLPCSIKRSFSERLDGSKTFVLIVGNKTNCLSIGSCRYCGSYNSYNCSCARGHYIDYRSFIDYECEKAARDGLKIVVLYNDTSVYRSLCPEPVRYKGTHIAAKNPFTYMWDYDAIKRAII